MNKKTVNLGITSSAGDFVMTEILSIKKSDNNNFKIFAFNENFHELSSSISDVFQVIPSGKSKNYLPTVFHLIEKYKLNIFLPWSDEEALKLSSHREQLRKINCKVIVSPKKVMNIISNKFKTYEKLKNAGLKTPEYSYVTNWEDIKKCVIDYGYPNKTIILKPVNGRGGRGVHVFLGDDNPPNWLGSGRRELRIENLDEKKINFHDYTEWLVMPCLKSPVYDVDVFSKKGDMLAGFVRKRMNPTGIPFLGNEIVNDEKTLEYARNICHVLKLDSIHDLDMMTDTSLGPVLIEVNPRPSGSVSALTSAGIPFLEKVLLSQIDDKTVFMDQRIKKNIKVFSYLEGLTIL